MIKPRKLRSGAYATAGTLGSAQLIGKQGLGDGKTLVFFLDG
jgi:hypothetical protein